MTAGIGAMLRWPEALAFAARYALGVVCLSIAAGAAQASSRFAVAEGNLIDRWTGLVWMNLSSSAGFGLPGWRDTTGWHVASGNEVFNVLPMTFGQTESVVDADGYLVFSFFASTAPDDPNCSWLGQDNCFSGWHFDGEGADGPTYNVALFG